MMKMKWVLKRGSSKPRFSIYCFLMKGKLLEVSWLCKLIRFDTAGMQFCLKFQKNQTFELEENSSAGGVHWKVIGYSS